MTHTGAKGRWRATLKDSGLWLALTLVVAVVVYVGKERQRKPPSADRAIGSAAGAAAPSTTLRFLTFWNEPYRTVFDRLLRRYCDLHPGLRIVQEAVPSSGTGNMTEMARLQIAAGDPPDLFMSAAGALAAPFIDAGLVENLDQAYAAHDWHKTLVPWAITSIRRHGHLWGVPFATRAMAFLYRADIFARIGLQVPMTYAQLEDVCRSLARNHIGCLSLGGKFGWNTMRLVDYFLELSAGPEAHDALNRGELNWNSEPVVNALSLLRRWIDNDWILPGFLMLSPADARMPFYRGQAAMLFEGDWMEAVMKDDEQDTSRFDFFIPPTDHTPQRFSAFPQQWMIPSGARHRPETVAFLDWYVSKDIQWQLYPQLQLSTASKGVLPDPHVWPLQHKWRQVMDVAQTFLPTDQVFGSELMDQWFEEQDALITGLSSPSRAAFRLAQAMRTQLAARQAEYAR